MSRTDRMSVCRAERPVTPCSAVLIVLGAMVVQFTLVATVNTTSLPVADDDNQTTNNTTAPRQPETLDVSSPYEAWQVALIIVACGILVVGTTIGNILVVTAVAIVRRLRTPSNLLIVSLAISDLLVALLDMPFAAIYEVYNTHRMYVVFITLCVCVQRLNVPLDTL